jgi:hypothetical protein
LVDSVDMKHALGFRLLALVHRVQTQVAGLAARIDTAVGRVLTQFKRRSR